MAALDLSRQLGNLASEGTIVSVDLAAGTCRVQLADDLETGDIEWLCPRIGKTSVWSPPSVGEQVAILAPEGDLERAFVIGSLSSDAHPHAGSDGAPTMEFEDGAVLRYDPESHGLEAILPTGGTITLILAGGSVEILGNVNINGTLTASEDVIAAGISLKSHKHGGVRSGGEQTGAPA